MPEEASRDYNLKTVHVLYLDVVRSEGLAVEDMSDVSATMRGIVRDVMDEIIPGWQDRVIVQPAGDGAGLVFSDDPTQPARVALAFVARWPAENNRVRLGINTGPVDVTHDVLTGRQTCQGDGMVAANRVMSVNSEGRIMMTQDYVSQLNRFRGWADEISLVGWRTEKERRMLVYELRQPGLSPLPPDLDANVENVRHLEERIAQLESSQATSEQFIRRALEGFSIVEAILSRPRQISSSLREDLDEIMRPFVANRDVLFPGAPGYVYDFAIFLDLRDQGLALSWRAHHPALSPYAAHDWIGKGLAGLAFAKEAGGVISDAASQEDLLDRNHRTDWNFYRSLGIKVLHAGVSKVGAIVVSSDRSGQIVEAHDLLLELIAQCLGYYLTSRKRSDIMQRRRKNRA